MRNGLLGDWCEIQPQARARDFSSDQGAKPQAYWSISRISQHRAGGKDPRSAWPEFHTRLLGPRQEEIIQSPLGGVGTTLLVVCWRDSWQPHITTAEPCTLQPARIKRGARHSIAWGEAAEPQVTGTQIHKPRRGGIAVGRARQAVCRPSGARVLGGRRPGVRRPHPRLSNTALRALKLALNGRLFLSATLSLNLRRSRPGRNTAVHSPLPRGRALRGER